MNYVTTKLTPESFWITEKDIPYFFMGKKGAKQILDALDFVLQAKDNCCVLKLLQNEADTPEMLTHKIEYGQYTIVFAYHYQQLTAKKIKQLTAQNIELNHLPAQKNTNKQLTQALRYNYKNIQDKINIAINGNIIIFSGSTDIYNLLYNEILDFYENAYNSPEHGFWHIHFDHLLNRPQEHDFSIFYYESTK